MNSLTGESKYIDVLEKSLYNGASDGLSLSGDRFFYGNVLESEGNHNRREWFGTACCPANIARLISSLGDYIYMRSDDGVWINLFVASATNIQIGKNQVNIKQETNYPWSGDVKIAVNPSKKSKFKMRVRMPGWINDQPSPGETYQYLDKRKMSVGLDVNGKRFDYTLEKGYAVIEREWKKGDIINFSMPMEIRRVIASEKVKADRGRVALQRGPLMYCVEGPDNGGAALNIIVPDDAQLEAAMNSELLGGVVTITGTVPVVTVSRDGTQVKTESKQVTAIPYYTWNNRGPAEMQVWIPRKVEAVRLKAN